MYQREGRSLFHSFIHTSICFSALIESVPFLDQKAVEVARRSISHFLLIQQELVSGKGG